MTVFIYDKTAKGKEEITTRKYQLASRLRTLLVMVDGRQTVAELLQKVAALDLGESHLEELLAGGFIAEAKTTSLQVSQQPQPAASATAPENSTELPNSDLGLGHDDGSGMSEVERFQAAYIFFNETIKSTLGLRGYMLQLKVERAGTLDEFRELRLPYLEAVKKAKGTEMARSLRDRLDQILYPGGKPDAESTLM
jgi:hypothetical protein